MSCEFCEFNHDEREWHIELYRATSYEYEGKKYFLEVTYPADGEWRHRIYEEEVYYCPKCGRKLNE